MSTAPSGSVEELLLLGRHRELDAEFVDGAERMYRYPLGRGVLAPHLEALVLLAVETICTAPRPRAAEEMARAAIRAGATPAQVLVTVELASVLGLHSLSWGLPLLRDVLRRDGQDLPHADRVAGRRFRGQELDAATEAIAAADPEFFELMSRALAVAWDRGALTPGECHLICIAIDATATHLYEPGFELHVREALRLGVDAQQIVAVLQLCALVGLRGLHAGLDAYAAALIPTGEAMHNHEENTE